MIEVYNILKELNLSNSVKYKLEILEKYKGNGKLKKYLLYVYNHNWNYYLTTLPKLESSKTKLDLTESNFYQILDKLKCRSITGNSALAYFKSHLESCDEMGYELYSHIIGRDIRCNIGIKSINKVIPNLISDIFYMRCSKLDEKTLERFDTMPEGFLTQAKLDGQFSYIIKANDTLTMLTRAGTVWTSDSLKEDMINCLEGVYIGEALIYKDVKPLDRKTGNGLINKFIKRESTLESLQEKLNKGNPKSLKELETKRLEFAEIDKNLHFVIWDSLTLQEFEQGLSTRPYTERFGEAIKATFMTSKLKPVASYRVYSMKEAQAIADEFISEGGEGAIIKKLDTIWKDGTSKDMIKIKVVLDADLLCVDVEEGSGKYKGKVGALVLETSCGRLRVKVGTGLNDLDRAKPFDFYIGKVIEIQYNEFIKSKSKSTDSLFLPRFVEVREDKNTATSYEEVVG